MSPPAEYFTRRGISGERELLCFFAWLAHVSLMLAERIRSSLPDDRRAPEGRGLEGIRGASYALNVPAKQNGFCYGFGGTHAATTTDNLG
jgi:hypothetical protein